jgi:putative ABC transport system substrate-binding protein
MRRREFIARMAAMGGIAAVWPRTAHAQAPAKVYRVGLITASTQVNTDKSSIVPFLEGLAAIGYVQGRNLVTKVLYGEGRLDRLPGLAAELVKWKPDLIFAPAAPSAAAVKAQTTTIPIVFCFVNEPVGLGFAKSLAQPGGNLTGLSNFSVAIAAKRIELLHEIVPSLRRLCAWRNSDAVNDILELNEVKSTAARFGMKFLVLDARMPVEYELAAAATRAWAADAIYVNSNPVADAYRKQIIDLIAELKLPAIYFITTWVHDGGLVAYAVDFPDLARRAAVYADKILKGARPGDLPIEQPTTVKLAVNLDTARLLGLVIPQSVLLRADEVIE